MATKEMKAILISVGTAFLAAASAMLTNGINSSNYIQAGLLALVGIAAFYIRETLKEDPSAR